MNRSLLFACVIAFAVATMFVGAACLGQTCSTSKCSHSCDNLAVSGTGCAKFTYNITTECHQKLNGNADGTTAAGAAHQIAWYDSSVVPETLICQGTLRKLPTGTGGINCGKSCTSGYYNEDGVHSTTGCPASTGESVVAKHTLYFGVETHPGSWSDSDQEVSNIVQLRPSR